MSLRKIRKTLEPSEPSNATHTYALACTNLVRRTTARFTRVRFSHYATRFWLTQKSIAKGSDFLRHLRIFHL